MSAKSANFEAIALAHIYVVMLVLFLSDMQATKSTRNANTCDKDTFFFGEWLKEMQAPLDNVNVHVFGR